MNLLILLAVLSATSTPLVNCDEIQHELNLAVERGHLTQVEADKLTENCHRYNHHATTIG